MNTLSKRFFPVIHCVDPDKEQGVEHSLANARTAFDYGADGIFLIGHGMNFESLCNIYGYVREQFSDRWIGANFLDVSGVKNWGLMEKVVRMCPDLNALWMDGVPSRNLITSARVELLGGVAFKYIDPKLSGDKLVDACNNARHYVDTITTSGDKTGSAPDVEKLDAMRKVIGPRYRFALASGVSVDNVDTFLPFVDTFLVASSIIEVQKDRGNHEYLVPEKVKALAEKIHA